MTNVFSLLLGVAVALFAVQSGAQPLSLNIPKKEVLALVQKHPEWKGVDIKQLSKEEAKLEWGGQGGENVRFDSIPMFGHSGQMHVMFMKRKSELRVRTYYWTTSVTNSDSLSDLSRIFNELCNSFSAEFKDQGKEYGNPDEFHFRVWNRGPESFQVSCDPKEYYVSIRANYLPIYEN